MSRAGSGAAIQATTELIDLHLHTTASDGLLSPGMLVARAVSAGLTTMSVTDHDTTAGLEEAAVAAGCAGIRFVPGIEITAVERGRDVHILGYFFDPLSGALERFLLDQRADRVRRVREMAGRLDVLGFHVDVERLLDAARQAGRSVGRPALADALVAAGHAVDRNDAFARLLGNGRPAFVPRRGVGAREVVRIIHEAGGVASLAHPGIRADDALIPALVGASLDALEVWHSDHTPQHAAHYHRLAAQFGLERSGGSDFHGDGGHRVAALGSVDVPAEAFEALAARAGRA